MPATVCVVGSIHMDLVVRAERFAQPGETLLGSGFDIHPGGKGANQAVAASRMGAQVSFVGCLGDDEWGSNLRGVLASEGIDIQKVRTVEKEHTGVAILTVVPDGENSTVLAPGANARLTVADVDEASGAIGEAELLVIQGEVPAEANQRAIELARKANTLVLLNPSPAAAVPNELLREVDILVLNRNDARVMVGDEEGEVAPSGLARRLASYGPGRVVLTLGNEGALHFNGEGMTTVPAYGLKAVDVTAAGDAFVGALAALRAEGARLKDAVRFACAAGALATTSEGALTCMPMRDAVEGLVKREVGASS